MTTARGFSLDHTELVMSASIDPYFRGYFNLALLDEEVAIEEAWFQTSGLGNGLSLKGGRFLSGLGYQNEKHPHAWDFADNSLMYRALFGEAYGNDGVQLKWVAPTELFMEFGAEAGRGANFPGTDRNTERRGQLCAVRPPRRRHRRLAQLARGLSYLACQGQWARQRTGRSERRPCRNAFLRKKQNLGGGRRLEMGAQRQRPRTEFQVCRRVFPS